MIPRRGGSSRPAHSRTLRSGLLGTLLSDSPGWPANQPAPERPRQRRWPSALPSFQIPGQCGSPQVTAVLAGRSPAPGDRERARRGHDMETNSLTRIAAEMRKSAATMDAQKRAMVTLARGLRIVLERAEDEWRLKLGREGVFPSLTEVAICVKAFGVPEGTDPQYRRTQVELPKTGRKAQFAIVELAWREA